MVKPSQQNDEEHVVKFEERGIKSQQLRIRHKVQQNRIFNYYGQSG